MAQTIAKHSLWRKSCLRKGEVKIVVLENSWETEIVKLTQIRGRYYIRYYSAAHGA